MSGRARKAPEAAAAARPGPTRICAWAWHSVHDGDDHDEDYDCDDLNDMMSMIMIHEDVPCPSNRP